MFKTTSNRKIKFALIGCGRVPNDHFGLSESLQDECELVAACDTDPAAFETAVKRTGVRGYGHYVEMLAETDADVIVIITLSGLHLEQAVQVSEAGFHVATERPITTRPHDGERIVQAADKAGRRLFMVGQNHLSATLQPFKCTVMEKRFGKTCMMHLDASWTRPQSYYDQGNGQRGIWEFDDGAFMNQASHYADLMGWLIGPVEDAQAMVSIHRNIETEDTGVADVHWRNGALGSMAATTCTYPKNLEGSITILGETDTVRIDDMAVNEIREWNLIDERDYNEQVKNVNYEATSVYGFGHPLYYKNVIDALHGQAEPTIDGREGLKSLELTITTYPSARDRKTVGLPLVC